MCLTNYLAEKLPIEKTMLPDFLQPNHKNGLWLRRPHLNGLLSVNKSYEMAGGVMHEDTCKRAVTALTQISKVSGMALPHLKRCLRDLLYRDPEVMNNLQLAIWCASSLDKGVDSKIIIESTRDLVDLDDINRYNAWRTKWRTYQPRHNKDRASILRSAILSTVHDTAAMADLYALMWLRDLCASLDHPSVKYGDELRQVLATDDRWAAHWIAIWFAYDSYRPSAEGLVNPMRGLRKRMDALADVEQEYKLGAQQSEYQTYLTAKDRFFDVKYPLYFADEDCCCCCKCCKEKREKERKEVYNTAEQEMFDASDHPVVCKVKGLKDRQSALVSEMREFINKVNQYSDFEVILSEEKLFVGEVEECGTESYTKLYIDFSPHDK